ncbi:hypothetical protein Glove_302g38 [Diversispora epigaea]|uniref:Uncharacterized protein n=1 Tax=Diversispora epigaea TaxID=1348612 RepID=A0A397HVG5_9GLOM|nr:hypothetical protein Glove_302g38 [Diversispora epigaea]
MLNSSISRTSAKISSDITIQLSKSNDVLAKFRELWWIQGNIHPKAHWEEALQVAHLLKNGNVYVNELPLGPHETCSGEKSENVDITIQLSKSNDVLAKFRELWWIQGNIHPKAHWEEALQVFFLLHSLLHLNQ